MATPKVYDGFSQNEMLARVLPGSSDFAGGETLSAAHDASGLRERGAAGKLQHDEVFLIFL